MSWFRIDDMIAFGAKHVAAGNEAVGAWARAGAWCSANRTDGFVPADVAHAIAHRRVWLRLIEARAGRPHGLVEVAEGGYRLHDFLEYNPAAATADDAARRRSEARAVAGRKGGLRSGATRKSLAEIATAHLYPHEANQSFASSKTKQSDPAVASNDEAKRSPDPDPDPDPDPRDLDQHADRVPEDVHATPDGGESTQGAGSPEVPSIGEDWLRERLTAAVFEPLGEEHLRLLAALLVGGVVPPAAAEAAISDFEVTGTTRMSGDRNNPDDLVNALMGYAAVAKRRYAEAKTKLDQPKLTIERQTMELWHRLWAAEHGGAEYEEAPGDWDVIRGVIARARTRASELGLERAEQVLRHTLVGYLKLDDRKLVSARYPIALLPSRLPSIGKYTLPVARCGEADVPAEADVRTPPPEEAREFVRRFGDLQQGELRPRKLH